VHVRSTGREGTGGKPDTLRSRASRAEKNCGTGVDLKPLSHVRGNRGSEKKSIDLAKQGEKEQ